MGEQQQYRVVGIHGAPTPETAPHGYGYRRPGHRWTFGYLPATVNIDAEWYPLPAPPTEQAPPPEPVARWRIWFGGPMGASFCGVAGSERHDISEQEAKAAADALNALDRDGVAWGPGRPMSELPETGRVLVLDDEGAFCVLPIETVRAWSVFVCWWPLPSPRGGP